MAVNLTLKKRRLAIAWMRNGGNGTEAAREAGYTGDNSTLASRASTVLADPTVRQFIADRLVPLEKKVEEAVMDVLGSKDENTRLRAAWLGARIKGMLAPQRTEHLVRIEALVASAPLDLPALVEILDAMMRSLPASDREAILARLAGAAEPVHVVALEAALDRALPAPEAEEGPEKSTVPVAAPVVADQTDGPVGLAEVVAARRAALAAVASDQRVGGCVPPADPTGLHGPPSPASENSG